MDILILSGCDHIRFPTMINQKAYADRHGYRYHFDMSPRADRSNVYNHKLSAIADALPSTNWLFWIDDDAAFTQLDTDFESLVPELGRDNLSAIFCASPINPQGGWTAISSGNFFVRNDAAGRLIINNALRTDLNIVQPWWDATKLGMYTHGDQDALVFQIKNDADIGARVKILEYERFNTRPYHFTKPGEHFLAHFTHLPETTKSCQMMEFAEKYGLTSHLLAEADLEPYRDYLTAQNTMCGLI